MSVRYFPISLDIQGRRSLVIGGGHEALKKTRSLLDAGASVHVISPEVGNGLAALVRAGAVTLEERPYRPGDLQGYFLAFACTDEEWVNAAVAAEAEADAAGVLLNVVDQPPRCHFIMPAVVRRGSLTFAVTTDGKSPALAKLLQAELGDAYDDSYAEFLDVLGSLRPGLKASGLPLAARSELLTRIVRSSALASLQAGDRAGMQRTIAELLKECDQPCPPEWSISSAPGQATRN